MKYALTIMYVWAGLTVGSDLTIHPPGPSLLKPYALIIVGALWPIYGAVAFVSAITQ